MAVKKKSRKKVAKRIAGRLFGLWNSALNSGNAKVVAGFYTKDAVLISTMPNEVRIGRKKITKYFDDFLSDKSDAKIKEIYIRVCEDNFISFYGKCEFKAGKGVFLAMYSFDLVKKKGKWLIRYHYS